MHHAHGCSDAIRRIIDDYQAGRRELAVAGYERWPPLINYENRQCGLLACKALMKEGGVIASDAPRHRSPRSTPPPAQACWKSPAASTRWCCAGGGKEAARSHRV